MGNGTNDASNSFAVPQQQVVSQTGELALHGLVGVTRRKKWRTTKRDRDARPAPDLRERDFQAHEPNELWVADITYIPTWSGFLYLAVVVDAWCCRR